MAKMDNCTYNKTKLLHQMSRLDWFIDKYAKKDAKKAKHGACQKAMTALQKDLHKHMKALHGHLSKKEL